MGIDESRDGIDSPLSRLALAQPPRPGAADGLRFAASLDSWTKAHHSMLALAFVGGVFLGHPEIIALVAMGSFLVLLAHGRGEWPGTGPLGFGFANTLTLTRLILVVTVAACWPGESVWLGYALLAGLALDGLDGLVARRRGEASELGAHFDMEVDAASLVIMAGLAVGRYELPLWGALAAALRPILVLARANLKTAPALSPRRTQFGRAVFVLICLAHAGVFLLPSSVGHGILAAATVMAGISFAPDFKQVFAEAAVRGPFHAALGSVDILRGGLTAMVDEGWTATTDPIRLPTKFGEFAMKVYTAPDGKEHVALYRGDVSGQTAVLARIHSECMTGDVFGSLRCDCGEQLSHALKTIAASDRGVLVYLRQEGRGIGLSQKMRAYQLQDEGFDTVEANLQLGHRADERDYRIAAEILKDLGVQSVRLLTNNPEKIVGLEEHGIAVTERIATPTAVNPENRAYLLTKTRRMNHKLKLPS